MRLLQVSLLVMVLVLVVVLSGAAQTSSAAPENQANATLTFVGQCEVSGGTACTANPTTGPGYFMLQSSVDGTVATLAGILRFNVDAPFSIAKARLNLALGNGGPCGVPPSVAVRVYGTANGDDNPPQRGVLLATVDGGTTQVPFPGTHTVSPAYNLWTDAAAGTLSGYLQAENAVDNVVTLWVETIGLGNNAMFFEGSSGTLNGFCGSGGGGGLQLGPPMLQLADNAQPLAVSLRTFSATEQRTNWPLYIGLAVLAVLIGGLLFYRRRVVAR